MSTINELGITCPITSEFYVCRDAPTPFLGCCEINPCVEKDGDCAVVNAASFDSSAFDKIYPQDCIAQKPGEKVEWYVCAATDPPFMGCCTEDPCEEGVCHPTKFRGAKLSSNKRNAAIFLSTASVPSSSSTSTSSSTSSLAENPTPTGTDSAMASDVATDTSAGPTSSDGPSEADKGSLSHGAVAGIASASTFAGLAFLGVLIYLYLRKRKSRRGADAPYDPHAGPRRGGYHPPEGKPASPYTPDSAGFHSLHSQHQQYQRQMLQYYHMHPHGQASPPYYPVPPPVQGYGVGPWGAPPPPPPHPPPTPAMLGDGEQAAAELPATEQGRR